MVHSKSPPPLPHELCPCYKRMNFSSPAPNPAHSIPPLSHPCFLSLCRYLGDWWNLVSWLNYILFTYNFMQQLVMNPKASQNSSYFKILKFSLNICKFLQGTVEGSQDYHSNVGQVSCVPLAGMRLCCFVDFLTTATTSKTNSMTTAAVSSSAIPLALSTSICFKFSIRFMYSWFKLCSFEIKLALSSLILMLFHFQPSRHIFARRILQIFIIATSGWWFIFIPDCRTWWFMKYKKRIQCRQPSQRNSGLWHLVSIHMVV